MFYIQKNMNIPYIYIIAAPVAEAELKEGHYRHIDVCVQDLS